MAPLLESLEKMTWTFLSVFRRPRWPIIITQAGKTNIPPATSVALKEKRGKNVPKQSSNFIALFLVALFSLYQSQHQHFIEHYQFHYLASY